MKKASTLIILTLAATQLTACSSIAVKPPQSLADRQAKKEQRVNAVKEKVALSASSSEVATSGSLLMLEKQYKNNSDSPSAALAYAQGLRQADYLNRAFSILKPFADMSDTAPGVKTEMSIIALGLGNYNSAEKYAQAAIMQNPSDHQAYQNLGITLDAKEMHPEAERAFRKGLEHWEGDPTAIMNNLALNLATQGFIDEAVEILEKAKTLNPDRIEIERNLRIVRTLNER